MYSEPAAMYGTQEELISSRTSCGLSDARPQQLPRPGSPAQPKGPKQMHGSAEDWPLAADESKTRMLA